MVPGARQYGRVKHRFSPLVGIAVFALTVGILASLVPVEAEVQGQSVSCGAAGPWVIYVGGYDPTGPTDTPETYAEFLRCRDAASPWVYTILIAAALTAGVGGAAVVKSQRRRS